MAKKRAAGERLLSPEVAERAGITASTLRNYVHTKQMPAPDGRYGQFSWWYESTLADWFAQRAARPTTSTDQGESQ